MLGFFISILLEFHIKIELEGPFADVVGPRSVTERVLNEELAALDDDAGYIWRTVGDDKVRGENAARAGQVFTWNNPPEDGYVGEDYNCRCWAEPLNASRHVLVEEARRAQEELLNAPQTLGFENDSIRAAQDRAEITIIRDRI